MLYTSYSPLEDVLLTESEKKGVAAARLARQLGPGNRIVTILCDSGTRHLSKFWAQAGNVGGRTESQLDEILGPRQE